MLGLVVGLSVCVRFSIRFMAMVRFLVSIRAGLEVGLGVYLGLGQHTVSRRDTHCSKQTCKYFLNLLGICKWLKFMREIYVA